MLPKVRLRADMVDVDTLMSSFEERRGVRRGTIPVLPLIETVEALPHLDDIAAHSRTMGLAFGPEDMAASMGAKVTEDALVFPAKMMLYAAKRVHLPAYGFVGSIADFSDKVALLARCSRAYDLGFDGALGIHPSQVPVFNDGYMPSDADLNFAKSVVEAFETAKANGKGATSIKGKMIDKPVLDRALRTMKMQQRFAK